MMSDSKETSVMIQDVDSESMKYNKNDKNNISWAAKEILQGPKKPDIGRVVGSNFNLLSGYSSSIIITESDFILMDWTSSIALPLK